MWKRLASLFRDEEGISAIEYAVLGAVVVAAVSTGAVMLRDPITNVFTDMAGDISPD
jgi:Flp pilus assembly pilin Flp